MRCTGFAAILMLLGAVVPALGDDDIASKMVNDPTVGWGAMGKGAKVELYKDPTVQGGMAERLTIGGNSAIDFNANIQNESAPYNSFGSAALQVGPQWKMYLVVATADKDYKESGAGAQLQLATGALVIDLGPLFILNYGQGYDKTKLPHS